MCKSTAESSNKLISSSFRRHRLIEKLAWLRFIGNFSSALSPPPPIYIYSLVAWPMTTGVLSPDDLFRTLVGGGGPADGREGGKNITAVKSDNLPGNLLF